MNVEGRSTHFQRLYSNYSTLALTLLLQVVDTWTLTKNKSKRIDLPGVLNYFSFNKMLITEIKDKHFFSNFLHI